MRRVDITIGLIGLMVFAAAASGQTSSMMVLPEATSGGSFEGGQGSQDAAGFTTVTPNDGVAPSTRAIECVSAIAVPRIAPRKFEVENLITIIVRQQKKYEADAQFDTEKKWEIDSTLSEMFRFYPNHHIGATGFTNGEPNVKYAFNNKYETDGSNEREDKFITRIEATIIDVKPNGNLVIEARQEEEHDEEKFVITVTGVCRSEDVTADNTILSTQIANLVLIEENKGSVRDATQRGWIPRVLDWIKPF